MNEETRLGRRFQELKARSEKALVAFVTAGDPSMGFSRAAVLALLEAGADVIELGIPFSDPLLDGPVIQAASHRALEHGARLSQIFDLVEELRRETQAPLVLMTCLNPIHRYGPEQFARRAQEAGVDGVLVTDLPPEEAEEWVGAAGEHHLDRVFMLAPTSSPERIAAVARVGSGFLYCQSRAGVTGERQDIPPELEELVSQVRTVTDLPVAVGFGISTAGQAAAVTRIADGVIVGSAFVRIIGENESDPGQALSRLDHLARRLKSGATGSAAPGDS